MPDPNLPHLITFSTPGTTQPYQERILAALEDGSRLETYSERWDRERNESLERWNDLIKQASDSLVAFLSKAMQKQWEFERGPIIGRKRRARRARGRRRGNA